MRPRGPPAVIAVLVRAAVLALLGWVGWPMALVLLPFLAWAGLSPILGRAEIDRRGGAARGALGLIGAYLTETIQGLSELAAFQAIGRRRAAFLAQPAVYHDSRSLLLAD